MGNTCASRDKPTDPSLSPVNSSLPYEENRLRYGQYKAEYVSDQTPLAMLTRFEAKLPLIVESFKDSLALKDITVAGSVVRQVLLDDTLKDKKKKGFLIPNILLLANMYCPSNPGLRAQKFFELCQENLDPQISANDKELKQLFMKMLEYSYVFIIRVYKANMVQGQDATIDNAWIPDEDKLEEIYDQMYEEFQDAVFKSKSKDSREEFLEELKEEIAKYNKIIMITSAGFNHISQDNRFLQSQQVQENHQLANDWGNSDSIYIKSLLKV